MRLSPAVHLPLTDVIAPSRTLADSPLPQRLPDGVVPAATLAEVLATDQLYRRPQRAADYRRETELLYRISRAQSLDPSAFLDELLRASLVLCGAQTAGLSVAGLPDDPGVFRWTNLVGVYGGMAGGCTPAHYSPCGVTIERGTAQLFVRPDRYFTFFQGATPLIEEGLVVPFDIAPGIFGTIWIVAHAPGPSFDLEHVRVLSNIGKLASSAILAAQERKSAAALALAWRERAEAMLARAESVMGNRIGEELRSLVSAGTALSDAWERSHVVQRSSEHARSLAVDAQRQTEMLIEIGQALAGELDLSRLSDLIARLSREALGVQLGAFLSLTGESNYEVPLLIANVVEGGDAHQVSAARSEIRALPVTSTVVIPDLAEGATSDPLCLLMEQLPTAQRYRSCLFAPVRSRSGALLGNVLVAERQPFLFTPRHERILNTLVGIAAQSLDNATLFHEERTIRLQIEERERLARLHGDIGRALISPLPFDESLKRCCLAILTCLDAAFVRIWTMDADGKTLVLRTSVGLYTHLDGRHARIPLGAFKIGRIAQNRQPHVTNTVALDPEIGDHAWAAREGMVAFAGYPLIVGDEILGVIGLFARHELSPATIELLSAASVGIAANLDRFNKARELESAMLRLQQSNTDLDRFTAIASHDLLEPVRTVTSYLGLLQRRNGSQLDERGQGYVQQATSAAERMYGLVTSLLGYARLTGGELHDVPVPLVDPLRDATGNLATRISEVGGAIDSGPMPTVLGDRNLLTQLLQNLLANALKFRRPGVAPHIRISAQAVGAEWHIAIADNGIGIPDEHRLRIFEMFQRLHTEAAYAGAGIGLATCRRLVERMQGRLWVEPSSGSGATFVIALRAAPAA